MEILSLSLRLFVLILVVWITTCQCANIEDSDNGHLDDETIMKLSISMTDDKNSLCKCKPSCPNGGTRIGKEDGKTKCVCAEGYTGPTCETDCLRQNDIYGLQYTGTVKKTRSGRTCQRWDTQNPHRHSVNVAYFPGRIQRLSEAQNFCRALSSDLTLRPWCFTTDKNRRWEFCDIPFCKGCRNDVRGINYTGTVSTTNDGDVCLDGTYCHNSNNASRPWCVTVGGSKYCDRNIILCHGCLSRDAHDVYNPYQGTLSTTKSGLRCQRWDQQTPHEHNVTKIDNAWGLNEADNFCRNVGSRGKPWCYTMSNDTEWEYCDVPECLYEVFYGEKSLAN